jgi:hypothetical protein
MKEQPVCYNYDQRIKKFMQFEAREIQMTRICFFLLGLILLMIVFQGCTMIGRRIGRAIDEHPHTAEYYEIGALKTGDEKNFLLRNGQTVIGIFQRLDTLNSLEYQNLYGEITDKLQDSTILPQIGDTLIGAVNFVFRYFYYNINNTSYTPYGYPEASYIALCAMPLVDDSPKKISIAEINNLNFASGLTCSQSRLTELFLEGNLPLNSKVVLVTNGITASIELNKIERIRDLSSRKATWIGTISGGILDIAALTFLAIGAFVIKKEGLN